MRAAINKALLATLKPREKEYDVRDEVLKGFLIRVHPTGKMVYVCEYKRGRRVNIGTVGVIQPAEAREQARLLLAQVTLRIEQVGHTKKGNGITLQGFVEEQYMPWLRMHRKSATKTYAYIQRCFYPLFAKKHLTEITPVQVEQWRTKRLEEGISAETVNRDIGALKSALSKAVSWEIIDTHPLAKLKLLKTDRKGKIRFLSLDEEQRLREALKVRDEKLKRERASANLWREQRGYERLPDISLSVFADHLRPMVLLSINTGLRQGELFNLKYENVNLEQAVITIEGVYAKSGKTLHLPLNKEAQAVLKHWTKQNQTSDYVFHNAKGYPFDNVKKAWANILNAAEIRNFRWHDMRHHFASKLVMAGVDLNTVRELLGHSDLTMTLRYAHLAPEHKANAVAKLVVGEIASEWNLNNSS